MPTIKFTKTRLITVLVSILVTVLLVGFNPISATKAGVQYSPSSADQSDSVVVNSISDTRLQSPLESSALLPVSSSDSKLQSILDKPANQSEYEDLDPSLVDIIYDPVEITPPAPLASTNTPTTASIFQTLAVPSTLTGFSASSIQPMQSNVQTSSSFTVAFAQAPSQDLISALKFYPDIDFATELSGNTLTVTPTRLNRFTDYVFGLRRSAVCGQSVCSDQREVWNYSLPFKSAHWEKIVYGYSVLGRPLEAWVFGSSNVTGKRIMLTGATHGEEWHAGGLWMLTDFLIANPQEIVWNNKAVIIVPYVNIDGTIVQKTTGSYGLNARYNARGVNLNRSFPSGWIPCPVCGSYAGSELETSNLIKLVKEQGVTHMIAYHNQWPPRGIIFMGNTRSPATQNMAYWVSQRTGYPVGVYNGPEVATTSSVPGDQVVWAESTGITSILIEGTYRGVTDWNKNFPMYLAIFREF